MKKYLLCFVLIFLFTPTILRADILKVAVLELNNKAELTDYESAYLTDRVRDEMVRAPYYKPFMIMTKESIQELLPPGVKMSDCNDAECEVGIGRMIGADYIVTGEIGSLSGELRLTLKLHDCKTAEFLGMETVGGKTARDLEKVVTAQAQIIGRRIVERSGEGRSVAGQDRSFQEGKGSEAPVRTWVPGEIKKAVVQFESVPPGAVVLVDGRVICTSTPCSKEISEGTARISMQKDRYLPREEVLDIRKDKGEVRLSWTLEPDFGWLSVGSEPPGLMIEIDDRGYGTTPVRDIELSPGGHRVKVIDQRHYSVWENVLMERGGRREVMLTPVPIRGGLAVSAKDKAGNAVAAEVVVVGSGLFGTTPCSGELIVGTHEVKVSSGRGNWAGKVEIREHFVDTLRVELSGDAGAEIAANIESRVSELWSKLGIKWVKVEGGIFQMGSADGDYDEKPVHEVTLSDYWMSATEVTFDQYSAFCEATGRTKPGDSSWGRGEMPVINVSWDDAVAFCEWIGGRLPTEAEWEYAARGGNRSKGYKYSGNNKLSDVGWYNENSGSKTHIVGGKRPNELGLYDMIGNVWEWCSDWYGAYTGGAQRNPEGPGSGEYRVLRGGGWLDLATFCRPSDRGGIYPTRSNSYVGFRVCRDGSAR